ncbi:hypothetical protein [Roseibium sp.]|uniref:hypothetical protein n=1 Tax=Roseibium sp. TaxID=1936156 RepID=UPI003BAD1CCF
MPAVKQKNAKIWSRSPLDWYVEPERCTAQLLNFERPVGRIHDPCCGGGNIVKSCIDAGYRATGTDMVDRAETPPWFLGILDFMSYEKQIRPFDNIFMNPPFYKGVGTEAFIRKAIAMTRGKVAAYTEVRFLGGETRAMTLFRDHPPDRIYIITPRPSCPTGEYLASGGKAKNGSPDFCWLVWDNSSPHTATTFHWLTGETVHV